MSSAVQLKFSDREDFLKQQENLVAAEVLADYLVQVTAGALPDLLDSESRVVNPLKVGSSINNAFVLSIKSSSGLIAKKEFSERFRLQPSSKLGFARSLVALATALPSEVTLSWGSSKNTDNMPSSTAAFELKEKQQQEVISQTYVSCSDEAFNLARYLKLTAQKTRQDFSESAKNQSFKVALAIKIPKREMADLQSGKTLNLLVSTGFLNGVKGKITMENTAVKFEIQGGEIPAAEAANTQQVNNNFLNQPGQLSLEIGALELTFEQLLGLKVGSELEFKMPEEVLGRLMFSGVAVASCAVSFSSGGCRVRVEGDVG